MDLTAENLLRAADAAELRRVTLAQTMRSVAEAEEQVLSLEEELQRIQSLGAVLERTIALLRTAQERVQRDLAPVLASAVRAHLPAITDGRYDEVAVDPADLSVRVKETSSSRWRTARQLSGGTREQVFLLLRVGMAQHLASTGWVAPLLLDEVTAQSDSTRAREIMRVLCVVSRDRQVVIFTHDQAIVDWAAQNLEPPQDKVMRLAQVDEVTRNAGKEL